MSGPLWDWCSAVAPSPGAIAATLANGRLSVRPSRPDPMTVCWSGTDEELGGGVPASFCQLRTVATSLPVGPGRGQGAEASATLQASLPAPTPSTGLSNPLPGAQRECRSVNVPLALFLPNERALERTRTGRRASVCCHSGTLFGATLAREVRAGRLAVGRMPV